MSPAGDQRHSDTMLVALWTGLAHVIASENSGPSPALM
ncbi:hypothetical protein J2853_009552 [Streptosporangium lutulentum]|uniref:Uncharacterized protein n=1 Tax=Streptosporangium lutulentum TaxID=1461250 RepID=A0ABT9QU21_9ACTN|nr:hypothetical protein [Streptosporangium lutulentum]